MFVPSPVVRGSEGKDYFWVYFKDAETEAESQNGLPNVPYQMSFIQD